MKRYLLALLFAIFTPATAFGATILLTNTSDTINTFRTNVNTSLTNLNNGLLGTTLSTTTPWTVGQIVYVATNGAVTSVATGTVSSSGGITTTGSRYVIGGALSVSCDVASGSQPGCLSSTDWTAFNNKSSFAYPFTVFALNTFNTTTAATSTSLWTQGAFFASSTKQASQFPYASTTVITAAIATTSALYVSNAPNALALMGVDGLLGKFGGSSGVCTSQFPTSISALGALGTCTSVADAFITGQVGVAHGGTNIGSYTAGDILYASSPTVLTRIASTTSGTVLALVNGIPTWTATTSFSTGLSYANGVVTNIGLLSATCTGGTTCSGSNPIAINSFSYPFSFLLNPNSTYATSTNATTTSIWTKGVYFASSTQAASQFPYASSTMLSSQFASTTNLTVDILGSAITTCVQAGASGVLSSTGAPCASSFAWPFPARATSSILYFQGGLFASSTVQFGNLGFSQFVWNSAGGYGGFGTTTPMFPLTIASSARAQLNITEGNNTDSWAFRDAGTTFYISSTSPTTFATSTPVFTILGGSTAGVSGNIGIASSTPWARLSISTELVNSSPVFAISGTTTSAFASSTIFSISARGQTSVCETRYGTFGNPATSTAMVISWPDTCNSVSIWTSTSAATITIINATTTMQTGSRKLVEVCNPNGTAGAITWAGVEWVGSAPVQTTTAYQCDDYSFWVLSATSSMSVPTYKLHGTAATGFN